MTLRSVTVVVLAFREEQLLGRCVAGILASDGVAINVVVVDNGCTSSAVKDLEHVPGIRVIRPGKNLGFAGGCNLGASRATGEFLAFVNSDVLVTSGAIAALVTAASSPDIGASTASLRLMYKPDSMNSAGNPVHFLGMSWAGSLDTPASGHGLSQDVASASGAAMLLSNKVWNELGGFYEPLFAYQEDTELSLRIWQRGLKVVYAPRAVAFHNYEPNRNEGKYELLERNRLMIVMTVYGPRLLLLLLPALIISELTLLAISVRQGWLAKKLRGYGWLIRHRRLILDRRRHVQSACKVSERAFMSVLTPELFGDGVVGVRIPTAVRAMSRFYWRVVLGLTPS